MSLKGIKKNGIRVAQIALTAVMCASTVLGHFVLADGGDKQFGQAANSNVTRKSVSYENVTGQVDISNVKLSNLSDSVLANEQGGDYSEQSVIVTLKSATLSDKANGQSIASYLTTHEGKFAQNVILSEQKQLLNDLSALNIPYTVLTNYDTVLNGVAVKMDTSYVTAVKALSYVDNVVISKTYEAPKTVAEDTTSGIINDTKVYETGIYDSSEYAEEYGGKGMAVAVLDTGLDYTHAAFQQLPDSSTLKYTEADIYSIMDEAQLAGTPFSAKGNVYVSDKVPFAYDYADRDDDVYPSYSNHGTHVAGIIGGNADSYTNKDGEIAKDDQGNVLPFIGSAPHAQLVICKVFTDNLDAKTVGGATTKDILDALDDCVKLGVDVINMSLGTTCGFTGTDDGDEEGRLLNETYESIKANGISLICAASNDYSSAYGGVFGTNLTSNPDSGTVGSPSTYTSALSVASISGKKSPYLLANGETPVFYQESSDENNVDYDFAKLILEGKTSYTYKYVVIGGVGLSSDYQSSAIKNAIADAHANDEKIIALVKRGNNTFQEKVENAKQAGADAIIIYNNVAGEIKMTIGDVEDPIPAISISYEAGEEMRKKAVNRVGTVAVNPSAYNAGPFMSNFSSWGATSDLMLKPEITAHGGEITSAVPGGWDEQSGTSMATPNVAGLTANIRSYINQNYSKFFTGEKDAKKITQLTNQLMMSTATIVRDQKNLPYSPRKQGAGLASLDNIVSTNAYLFTKETETVTSAHATYTGAVDNRAKIELGEDEKKTGDYTLRFYINNLSGGALSFKLNTLMMTESVSVDGLSVAEQAYMLDDEKVAWTIGGQKYENGATVSIPSGAETQITVNLKLSADEKAYIDRSFANGMYVEGFAQLVSVSDTQCNLSIPFLGFYGDWEKAPMLDYDAFEIAEIEQDTSILEDEKPKASVWATQAYAVYWNDKFVLPMGSFVYKQNDDDDEVRKIYTTEEYSSISCYNDYQGDDANNYMTSTAIKGIYAGLLRNARQVDCRMYDVSTGELIYDKEVYRVNKAYTNGGATTPGFVKLELTPTELGLVENGQYRMEFDFHYHSPKGEDVEVAEENTFQFSFYIDYTSPVLESASIRYYDYKDGNKDKQRVYLDLAVYDNHYSMAALLCYMDTTNPDNPELQLCTEYVTPIYDAVKNGTTNVSIEITDIIEKYGDNLYVELDDYALNHSVYQIKLGDAQSAPLPSSFQLGEGEDNITLEKYATHKVALTWDTKAYPTANLSNFTWTVSGSNGIVAVKNGEIVGLAPGTATVVVSNGKSAKEITVTVTDSNKTLNTPSISFDVILNGVKAPVKAQGSVDVNVEQKIQLQLLTSPWYYSLVKPLEIEWSSTSPAVATVDNEGNVTLHKKGRASIKATIKGTAYAATVAFNVEEPFKVSNYSLTDYTGKGGVVYIPTDMNIMSIGEGAFKNNTEIETVIIPKTVTSIDVRAFYGCTNLKRVFFVDVVTQEIALAKLTMINREAFMGCTSLEMIDFSNCKTFTVARNAFKDCTSLKVIKGIEHIGTAYDSAFENCTSLLGSLNSASEVLLVNPAKTVRDEDDRITAYEAVSFDTIKAQITALDVSGLHVSGVNVFKNCSSVLGVTTGKFSAIGNGMFDGCKSLTNVTVSETRELGASAFVNCANLSTVKFKDVKNGVIGQRAFANCGNLISVSYENSTIQTIEAQAFANTYLNEFTLPDGIVSLGSEILAGTEVVTVDIPAELVGTISFDGAAFKGIAVTVGGASVADGVIYSADYSKLVYVSPEVTSVTVLDTTTEIGAYALAHSKITTITIPASVEKIGEGAFSYSTLGDILFEAGSALQTVGKNAFTATKLTQITLPKSVVFVDDGAFTSSLLASFAIESGGTADVTFGSYVFAECEHLVDLDLSATKIVEMGDGTFYDASSLATVKLPSLTSLGEFTFFGATELTSVSFGATATTVGTATFYTYAFNAQTYAVELVPYGKLTSVTVGGATLSIGESAFTACTALESIDLKNATVIHGYAFYGCTSLKEVIGLNKVTSFGEYSFYNCKSLKTLNLENAEIINTAAFRIDRENGENFVAYNQINIPKVTYIGAFAFAGNSAESVTIPATLVGRATKDAHNLDGELSGQSYYGNIGMGAFARSSNLAEFKVADANNTYFAENGVLYRNVGEGEYELVSYPSNYSATEYKMKEGTVRVTGYAFAGAQTLTDLTVSYSVKAIGVGAFYDTAIASYAFEGFTAPLLESEYDESLLSLVRPDISYRGLFNNNFNEYLINFSTGINQSAVISTLKMTYPTNGNGYDSFLYKTYFTSRKTSGYVLTDDARTVKNNIETLSYDLTAVNAWATDAFAVNDANKQTVEQFAELLKQTHRLYNNLSGDSTQIELITQENINKFFAIEAAMRTVKAKFSLPVRVSGYSFGGDYKSAYTVGETFDISGLVITIEYDDYSTEDFTGDQISLDTAYNRPLTILDRVVDILCAGQKVRVDVTVSETQTQPENPDQPTPDEDELPVGLIIGLSVGGGLLLIAIATALAFLPTFKRLIKAAKEKNATSEDAKKQETEKDSDEMIEAVQPQSDEGKEEDKSEEKPAEEVKEEIPQADEEVKPQEEPQPTQVEQSEEQPQTENAVEQEKENSDEN